MRRLIINPIPPPMIPSTYFVRCYLCSKVCGRQAEDNNELTGTANTQWKTYYEDQGWSFVAGNGWKCSEH